MCLSRYRKIVTHRSENLSNKKLLELLDDDAALRKIYKNSFNTIKKYVLSNSGTAQDAQDLLQETMIVVYNYALKKDFKLTATPETFI